MWGQSRRQADRIIEQFDEFGAAHFRLSNLARISAENFREIAGAVGDDCIERKGEPVALIPENAARIRAFIRDRRPPRTAARLSPAKAERERHRELVAALSCVRPDMSSSYREELRFLVTCPLDDWLPIDRRLKQSGPTPAELS